MENTGIYLIFNEINGYKYIGQSKDIKIRWRNHKTNLKCNRHPNVILQRAYNKYGKDNFKFKILEICDESSLDEKELFWISNIKPEYNLMGGGNALHSHSEKTKKIISEKNKGKKRSEEHINSIRNYWLGKHHTEDTKEKMSDSMKGKIKSNIKKVICLNDGNIFDSTGEAAKNYRFKDYGCVGNVCRGKYKHYKGYVFKYLEDYNGK